MCPTRPNWMAGLGRLGLVGRLEEDYFHSFTDWVRFQNRTPPDLDSLIL
jgi:hypothetical protein